MTRTQKASKSFTEWVKMMDEDHTNWIDLDQDVELLRKHAKKSLKKEGDHAEVARSRMLIYILFGL